MKNPEQVCSDVARRVQLHWAAMVTGEVTGTPASGVPGWPAEFGTAPPTSKAAAADFAAVTSCVQAWRQQDRAWVHAGARVVVRFEPRRVAGTHQQFPVAVGVRDLDAAAGVAGGMWPDRIRVGRARAAAVANSFGASRLSPALVTQVVDYTDVDFQTLLDVGAWLAAADPVKLAGWTPRQVPVPGVHAKWLQDRVKVLSALLGRTSLGLASAHPPRLHLTYLDPDHRAQGGRRHDCLSVGDAGAGLPYLPSVVVISENKDTAVHFPRVPGGVAVEGNGAGGSTAAAFGWVTAAPRVVYWGDMDADGLEILAGFRAAGVPAKSMLMDLPTYRTYARFGTDLGKDGKSLGPRKAKSGLELTDAERELYEGLCSVGWTGHRRVEQERIPLSVAATELERGSARYRR